MADPASSAVPGWALWALTITGQPAASAEATSPPAAENASGKLLGPNTATGPTPMWRWRTSGAGSGARSGWASSMRTPWCEPARTSRANSRTWFSLVDQISIEAAQPKIDLEILRRLPDKTIILGVIDNGDHDAETPEVVADRIRQALRHVSPERLILAPDCGMKYMSRELALAKLSALVQGTAIVREELQPETQVPSMNVW